jgi:type I restriction enzyme M protein
MGCDNYKSEAMALKKSELYSKLWKSCDELRGGMDASQYKDYILVLLFVKYVSDKYAGDKNAVIEVPEGGSFADIVHLRGSKEIGDKINKIIAKLAEANDLKGIIDVADFNNEDKLGKGKEMQDRLSNLVAIFNDSELNFSKNRADGDDILGDAYEYLMRNFATESGKSKGQFYTPAEVSRVMAKVIGIDSGSNSDTIYDPTCGSGSLLLKASDETQKGITIYGQEMDNATRALAKMNMILHGHPSAEIYQGNTLADPLFKNEEGTLKTFDFAVANPPFSSKAWSNGVNVNNDEYDRFTWYGIPPAKNGDYAFLLHLIRSLKSTGKGAIILPHGVLFRGNVEAQIRTQILRRGFIKGIIGLPANLFYGTGIPACIIVIDKAESANRQGIFMIDASKGYLKDGNKNRLREQDIHKIVDVFNKQLEIPKYSRLVSLGEIEANEYNLNIPRYIDSQEEEDIQDIAAHIQGGIPNHDVDSLSAYWEVYPSLREELFSPLRPGYSQLCKSGEEIKDTIFHHPQFLSYREKIDKLLEQWSKEHLPLLYGLNSQSQPKEVIGQLAETMLATFSQTSLIDKYDVYQHLMVYWEETMKDDVYLIVEDGWQAKTHFLIDAKGKPKKDEWDCDLIPKSLVRGRYFALELTALEELEAEKEAFSRSREEMEEEYTGEEGILEDIKNDKGKITKATVQARIKELQQELDWGEELKVLKEYLGLMEKETEAGNRVKMAEKDLDKQLLGKYHQLSEEEIKTLVVKDKWMTRITEEVTTELDRISQRLTQRIRELAERYESTLGELSAQVEDLEAEVSKMLELLV